MPRALRILGLKAVGFAPKGPAGVPVLSCDLDETLRVFLKPLSFVQVTQFHSASIASGQSLCFGPSCVSHLIQATPRPFKKLQNCSSTPLPPSLPRFQGKPQLLFFYLRLFSRCIPEFPLFQGTVIMWHMQEDWFQDPLMDTKIHGCLYKTVQYLYKTYTHPPNIR